MHRKVTWAPGFVVIAGPDGTGKSTVASLVVERGRAAGLEVLHLHWRPGLLPRAGAVVGSTMGNPATPHEHPSRGRWLSAALLAYYWTDFLVGYWLRIRPVLRRGGLVVMERGWWDFAVDPRRYRLAVSPRLVRELGSALPHPALMAVLEAPVDVLLERKKELPSEELVRQTYRWRNLLMRRGGRKIILDATLPVERIADGILKRLGDETGLRKVWVNLPPTSAPRWSLPRGPRRMTAAGLYVYHPVTLRGRIGWEGARGVARLGAFRLLPSSQGPNGDLWDVLGPHLPRGWTMSLARANHPGRYVALLFDDSGRATGFAKIATDDPGRAALTRERKSIQGYGELLPPPLYPPKILGHDNGILLLKPIGWAPRTASWHLPPQISRALGLFYRRSVQVEGEDAVGAAHGDCAPWNVLHIDCGWALLDWENAMDHAPAFYDVFHYLVQAHQELRRPGRGAILRGLEGRGRVGFALHCYAAAAEVELSEAPRFFAEYLRISSKSLDASKRKHRVGLRIREDLLSRIGE